MPTYQSKNRYIKLSKYENLQIVIEKNMWLLKTVTVIEILGMIKKGANKHINKLPDSPILYEIQQIALFGWFGLVSLFNGISTFVGYLMPKLFS